MPTCGSTRWYDGTMKSFAVNDIYFYLQEGELEGSIGGQVSGSYGWVAARIVDTPGMNLGDGHFVNRFTNEF